MTTHAPTTPAAVPRSRRRVRLALAALAAGGLAALAWAAFVQPAVRIVYNPSDSVPVGWYRITPARSLPGALPVDSIVLTTLPADAAALAAQRGYLPSHIPLLKRVGAVAPQHVCTVNGVVRIDGVPVAAVLRADRWGRPLPSWPQCRPLAQGELFLLSVTNPASFDSRYFGPISAAVVLGVAQPLRLEPQP
ncbi:TPA: S26 family signal peptidase [Pseudomonas aeruginosa]|uniref:S26 family signal peptidase n=1 Tax=Pseudomonas aeruginosa TaxID=287 RepID=UPI003981BCF2|nr:S26 family signal peptidase [Pseudomonas aeruginosa]HBP1309460.1 S26 family signal peptidase [Pseudomonas aeruginosa]HCF6352982.1 S26 family signal peptidase [Pseudomonas aeruginosa]